MEMKGGGKKAKPDSLNCFRDYLGEIFLTFGGLYTYICKNHTCNDNQIDFDSRKIGH